MKSKILIFIITYNASFRVLDLIKKIPFDYLKKHDFKVLISDDKSNDDTINYINKGKNFLKNKLLVKINSENVGYGANIKRCIKFAYKKNYDYVAMLHGDNQYNPKYIVKMLKILMKESDVSAVSGSRMSKKINALKGKMPIYKFIGNIFLTKIFNLLFGTNFTDCHTGYWAYNLRKIKFFFFLKSDNKFCFDLDMRLLLTKENLSIKEIPIKTYYGSERSSMHIIYALRFFYKVIKFKLFSTL